MVNDDQVQELEALEAIYPNELTVISRNPLKFNIKLRCENDLYAPKEDEDEDDEDTFAVMLECSLPPKYPDQEPDLQIVWSTMLIDGDEEELLTHLREEATSNLGMVMVFTLVSSGLEWLNKRKDDDERRQREVIERKKQLEDEEERKKFEGTRVTIESFTKWRVGFEKEMALLKKRDLEREAEMAKKLTGREMFQKDKSLIQSDLKFLDDEDKEHVSYDDTGVKVDTSLFDDLDDFDEDDDDDADFDPNDQGS